ncbi:hypothetical protein PA598K_04210 [Paenibacillus sp. 598K]|nr:hypothetical protein PA598K_04210 [Paenibacillus sp. 598K]
MMISDVFGIDADDDELPPADFDEELLDPLLFELLPELLLDPPLFELLPELPPDEPPL